MKPPRPDFKRRRMSRSSRTNSPINRQERQERAQAAAMNELDAQAEYQREKSNKLRKLRVEKEKADALRFKSWREQQA